MDIKTIQLESIYLNIKLNSIKVSTTTQSNLYVFFIFIVVM